MKKITLSLIIAFLFCAVTFSQGILRGTLTDENGEPVIGGAITLKETPGVGAMSDLNGQYSLKISATTQQTIVITYVGYKTIEDLINPHNGEIVIRNYNLVPSSTVIEEAVVLGKSVRSKEAYMERLKGKSAVSLDYISSETIKKIGDTNVASAVARTAGVSTNGSFITVRGIGDRYMKTAINGMRIPTLDPFTNNIKLDLFPASLVDNVVLVKTASPDLPGDWAGAYLSIETKDYPDKLSINIETSFGYNQQTSFKDIVSSHRSSTDWLGYDNGLRDVNHNDYIPLYKPTNDILDNNSNNIYNEFVALFKDRGLDNIYQSMGVTSANWSQNRDTYTKLGLIALGFYTKNQFDNIDYNTGLSLYFSSPDRARAELLLNESANDAQHKMFPDTWNTIRRKAPLNFSQSVSIGNQTNLFGKPLGYIAGFRYASATQFDPNSIKTGYAGETSADNAIIYDTTLNRNVSKETNGWSALLNLSYKYNPNHSISVLFMPNITGVNSAEDGNFLGSVRENAARLIYRNQVQFYESRKQMVYQLKSEHFIPGPGLKVELNISYTDGTSIAPDFKTYFSGGSGDNYRFYRYLSEKLFDSRIAAEFPLGKHSDVGARKIKFGAAYQYNYRKNDQFDYLQSGGSYSPSATDYEGKLLPSSHGFGSSKIKAGFAMIDYALTYALRFSGGVRVEQANMFSDADLYHMLGLPANDQRRYVSGNMVPVNPADINTTNFLPSANFILKLNHKELAPVNLRFCVSQTIARPSIREISNFKTYDNEYKSNVRGNPDLKTVEINNFDLRFEAYFESGDNISVTGFYKNFKNHISFVNHGTGVLGLGLNWMNSPSTSWLKGIELEGKKMIFKQLEFMANITLVDSRAKVDISYVDDNGDYNGMGTVTRTMLGQAPYVINGMLSYNSEKKGFSAAISYNVQGPRLVIIGAGGIITSPDIYEMPRNLLDFKASKTLGKHFGLSIKVQDILQSSVRRAYKFVADGNYFHHSGYLLDYDKYTWGTSYSFAVSYKL